MNLFAFGRARSLRSFDLASGGSRAPANPDSAPEPAPRSTTNCAMALGEAGPGPDSRHFVDARAFLRE